jgi:hypothetical protein
MFQKIVACLVLSVTGCMPVLPGKSAVTYTFSGGRFGDNLVAYCHAKWISYLYKIPLLYRPFAYSDQLMMHVLEEPFSQERVGNYAKIVNIGQVTSYTIEPDSNTLYIIPYFSDSIIERNYSWFFFYFPTSWNDKGFKQELRKMICPRVPLRVIQPPAQCISVALHVRVGTGFDIRSLEDYPKQTAEGNSQLKFPPFSYYHAQLKRVVDMFPEDTIYVYVFTDHTYPQEIVDAFEKELNCSRVCFDYRKNTVNPQAHVLEDFFSMTQFQCLIRPDANFSFVASRISDYELQISPWRCVQVNSEFIMRQIVINDVIYNEPQ